jgi:hypothetical protein
MKTAILAFFEFILFFLLFLVGSFLRPFHLSWFVSHPTWASTRFFVPDGLLLAILVYLVIVGIGAARKRLPHAAIAPTIALVIAVVLGLLSKFGWLTTPS